MPRRKTYPMGWMLLSTRLAVVLLAIAAPLSAFAADYTDPAALDALFAQLKTAPDAVVANSIEQQIWKAWLTPTVPELAADMDKAAAALGSADVQTAMDTYDAIVAKWPDYAEGWNRRATLEYEIGNETASLADIAKVLAIEPRHFGALSGRMMIELHQGNHADALKDMIAALAIDPYLSGKQLFPELMNSMDI